MSSFRLPTLPPSTHTPKKPAIALHDDDVAPPPEIQPIIPLPNHSSASIPIPIPAPPPPPQPESQTDDLTKAAHTLLTTTNIFTTHAATPSAIQPTLLQTKEEGAPPNYTNCAVGQFGKAMLLGMGWKEGERIGKRKNGLEKPVEYVPRVRGAGLGADVQAGKEVQYEMPKTADGKTRNVIQIGEKLKVKEKLKLQKNAPAQIIVGENKNTFGLIKDFETRKDGIRIYMYANNTNDILKSWDDEIKLLSTTAYKELQNSAATTEDPPSGSRRPSAKIRPEKSWLMPGILVKILLKGDLYQKKCIVEDVPEPGICIVKVNGRLIENMSQDDLETVVPAVGSRVMIIKPKHPSRGHIAIVLQRDRDKEKVTVQSEEESETTTLRFDDVCTFGG